MWTWLVLCSLSALLLAEPGWAALDLASMMPKSDVVPGWRVQGTPATYTRTSLYDYIDGGADFYLGYAFQRAVVADYAGPGGAKITVELYDMGSSYDAFGVFINDRAPTGPPVGQGASYAGGLLTFWKDRLFARVFTDRESGPAKAAIMRLGKAVAASVRSKGALPPLLRFLPQEGLAPQSVRYLHTDTALNSVLYLPGNPLRLNRHTAVVCGEYVVSKAPIKLVIVRYPDAGEAARAFASAAEMVGAKPMKQAPSMRFVGRSERFRWSAGALSGGQLVVAANAPDADSARRVLQSAYRRAGAGS